MKEGQIKLLKAVFSYNRFYLFKNTMESLLEFGPPGDTLVVDDGSNDLRLIDYLETLKSRGVKVVNQESHLPGFHGGLYVNMNRAVQHAVDNGYSHIFFIQDDVQFMWKDSEILSRINRVFLTCQDAAMVLPIFQKGILEPTLKSRLEPNVSGDCWHLNPYGICDLGVMPVSLLRDRKWKFGESEGENGKIWQEWGYKMYVLPSPTVAWVPWPAIRTQNRSLYSERSPSRKYFLKPLTEQQIADLRVKGLSEIPIHENYCYPWGWRCLKPYWFTKGRREYARMLWQMRRWPRWVGVS
jgi:hypothetical protein